MYLRETCVAAVSVSESAQSAMRSLVALIKSLRDSLNALIAARAPEAIDRASITYLLIVNKVRLNTLSIVGFMRYM